MPAQKIKKPKKLTPKKIRGLLWQECRRIIKAKYGNSCYTCGRSGLEGSNYQIGHFISSGSCGAFLRYDLRNLRPQCYNCNINNGGAGALYYRNMVEREGQEYVDQLFKDKNRIVNAYDTYAQLLEVYKDL